jgi:hypothetical protein
MRQASEQLPACLKSIVDGECQIGMPVIHR